jgi:hypothetical protein
MRNKQQTMSDQLLLLYTISKGNEAGSIAGTFKLMKIPFMTELESTNHGVNTFNYSFYRWDFGPFTTEIYEDADALARQGLTTDKKSARVTPRGEQLLRITSDLFQENHRALSYIDAAANKCAKLGFGALKQLVYKQTVDVKGKRIPVGDVPSGVHVLSALDKSSIAFSLDDDWIDTLWGYFNYSDNEMEAFSKVKPFALEEAFQ